MSREESTAFELLHPGVQKWVWDQSWRELRDIQEDAIRAILPGTDDVLIASATASGKTEAAFLPITSSVSEIASTELAVLYVSPLKALINDQYKRLESLLASIGAPVHRWHGDVSQAMKQKFRRSPGGVLLITPESLEATFINRGPETSATFAYLRYAVVDEVHAFIGTERGRQLQSLLCRVEIAAGRRIPRIGLSATIGDPSLAAEFLRPGHGESVGWIASDHAGQEVRLQIRGYEVLEQVDDESEAEPSSSWTQDTLAIADHLYDTLRGGRHLVFANARGTVEQFSDILRRRCERSKVPNEFFPHHGSLDRAVREEGEAWLRDGSRPVSLIATTTLELGIDVGSVQSVAQIGTPHSVASLRQRLGRSGRRGDPAVIRIYVRERTITDKISPQDRIRARLVQSIAVVELLKQRWCEPPREGALHLSTLVQQIMSLVAQFGGIRADQAWQVLCGSGPFEHLSPAIFAKCLRCLGDAQLIQQSHDKLLVLDLAGEQLVNHFDFYSAFLSQEEFRLVHGGNRLGTIPVSYPIMEGSFLIFAGRRWEVLTVDDKHKLIEVRPAKGGRVPIFGGEGPIVHDRVREQMRVVFLDSGSPPYLDEAASELLLEARREFLSLGLDQESIVPDGSDTLIFPWCGSIALHTLKLLLAERDLKASVEGPCIALDHIDPPSTEAVLRKLLVASPKDLDLARSVDNKSTEKHHRFLDDDLLSLDYASSRIDVAGALGAIRSMIGKF